MGAGQATARGSRGQALAELAILLPVLLGLMGATIDLARVYGAWVTVEGATRNAVYAAAAAPDATTAGAAARAAICSETVSVPGYSGNGSSCTMPTTTVTWRSTPVAGSSRARINEARVVVSLTFRTLVPWPLVPSPITMTSRATYETMIR